METPILKVELQRTTMDCGIAVLAMLTGEGYETVLATAAPIVPNVLTSGINWLQLKKVAKKLGYTTSIKRKRALDINNDTGALSLRSKQWKSDHLVVLKQGLIIDTDGTLWDAPIYLAAYKANVCSLLELEPLDAKT